MLVVDPTLLTVESLARASVILAVGLLLLVSSLVSIVVLISNRNLHDCIGYFLISLAVADLVCAVFIVPLSMFSSLSPEWHFFGDNSPVCKVSGYLQIVALGSTIYTFAWVAVDRYAAFMKPSRYESEHTLTRCKCWIAFSWVTAILIACPIIITKMEVNYYDDLELCVLNWSSTAAYSLTLGVLIIGPTLCTIVFTSCSICTALRRPEELEDIQKTIIHNDRNFVVSMFTLICFALSWLPIVALQLLPASLLPAPDLSSMKFVFMWLGIGGSSSKLLIFLFINPEFRRTFCALCTGGPSGSDSTSWGSDDFVACCAPTRRSCLASLFCCLLCGCCILWRKLCCRPRNRSLNRHHRPRVREASGASGTANNRLLQRHSPIDERVSRPMFASNQQGLVNSRYAPEYGSFSHFVGGYA